MNEELIDKANEIGFVSQVIGKSVFSEVSQKPFYYLWMCELQHFLRNKYNIEVYVESMWEDLYYGKICYASWVLYSKEDMLLGLEDEYPEVYHTYDEALEKGLLEGLEEIK